MLGVIKRLALPLAFVCCCFFSLHTADLLKAGAEEFSLYLEDSWPDIQEAQAMLEREREEKQPLSFVLWGQGSGTLSNPGLSRSSSVQKISLCGSSGLLYPQSTLLMPADVDGCLIDRETAQALFGSSSPLGSRVELDGNSYVIRGIVEGNTPQIVVQGRPKSEDRLSRVTLQIPAGMDSTAAIGAFQNRHGLSGKWLPMGFWEQAAGFFAHLAPVLGLLSAIFALIKTALSLTSRPVLFLACVLLAGTQWFLLLWMSGFSLAFPQELIPGKWSDFDFWGKLWQEKSQELLLQFTTPKGAPELLLFQQSLTACGFGLLAVLLFPLSLPRLKVGNLRSLWGYCAFFLLVAFLAVCVLHSRVLAENTLAWCFPPFYLTAVYLHQGFKNWLAGQDERAVPKCLPSGARHYRKVKHG